jgi:hypothetical protein
MENPQVEDDSGSKAGNDLSFSDVFNGTTFDYHRYRLNIEHIDSRAHCLMTASGVLVALIVGIFLFLSQVLLNQNPGILNSNYLFWIKALFVISVALCLLSLISSIFCTYPRNYEIMEDKDGKTQIKKTNSVKEPTIEELKNRWKGSNSEIINYNFELILDQILILNRKLTYFKWAARLFVAVVVTLILTLLIIYCMI